MWQTLSYYAALAVEAAVGVFGVRLYEEPRYAVIDRIGDRVEIRRYAPRLAAQVERPGGGEAARGEAFQLLFNYIAGANSAPAAADNRIAMTTPVELREPERIAMTAPVQTAETNDAVRMRFFLPAQFTRETAPAPPADPRVTLVTVPEETVATLRFSGSGRDMAARQRELLAALAASQWRPEGAPYALYYDAPFTLPFLRRNEAAVAVRADR